MDTRLSVHTAVQLEMTRLPSEEKKRKKFRLREARSTAEAERRKGGAEKDLVG